MKREEVSQLFLRRLNGIISDDELALWAVERILDNENPIPWYPVEEHDLIQDILDRCALAQLPQFTLTDEDVKEMLIRLTRDR